MVLKNSLTDELLKDFSKLEQLAYSGKPKKNRKISDDGITYENDYNTRQENTSHWVVEEDLHVTLGLRGGG